MLDATVLAYNLVQSDEAALDRLCGALGLRCRAVRLEDYAAPLGALVGIPVHGALPGPLSGSLGEAMLVMCMLSRPQMDALLNALRGEDIARSALKAVLTPTNVNWNAYRLHDELARERDALGGNSRR